MKPTLAILMLAACSTLSAVDRCSIVAEADVLFIGRLVEHRLDSLPDGGFELIGKVRITKLLHGASDKEDALPYLFRCQGCPPSPDVSFFTREDGVWGLKRGKRRWFSAGLSYSDPGWRPMHALEGLERCLAPRDR